MPNQEIDDKIVDPAVPPTDDAIPFPPMFSSGTDRTSDTPGQVIRTEADTQERLGKEDANKIYLPEALKLSFETTQNFAVSLGKELYRKGSSGPADPTWKDNGLKTWLQSNAPAINPTQAWRYELTDNKMQADSLLHESLDIQEKAKRLSYRAIDYPLSTGAATVASTLVDIDLPIALMTGGYSAEAKAFIAAGRFGRMVNAGVAAGAVNAGLAEGAYLTDPTADWSMVPLAGLAGAALGGLFGAAGRSNRVKAKTEAEFGENMVDGLPRAQEDYRMPVNETEHNFKSDGDVIRKEEAQAEIDKELGIVREPTSVDPSIVQPTDGGSTVGARQVNGNTQSLNTVRSSRIQQVITDAKAWARKSGVPQEWFDNASKLDARSPIIGKYARRFQDIINASPIASDMARAYRTNSAVLQQLAFNMYESGSGIIRNNKNGAMLMDMYKQRLQNEVKEIPDRMNAWMKDQGHGPVAIHTNPDVTKAWDEAVISELQYRAYKTGQASTNEHILAAADAIDRWSTRELEVRKGRQGEIPEFGTDTIQPKSGYFPQSWNGQQFRRLVEAGGRSYKDIEQAMSEIYGIMHPAMKPKDRDIWAQALVDRARRTGNGLSMNVRNVLDGEGRGWLEEFLQRNGHNGADAEKLIDRLTGNMETAGQKGNTKRRIDVDLRMQASNGIRMMDLIDHDVYGAISRRSHQAAGAGALARKGIDSRAKLSEIFDAALEEQGLTSIPKSPGVKNIGDLIEHTIDRDRHLTREDLEDMFGIFTGRRQEGAISPGIQRALKLTSLGLLGQVGITSIAEFGPAMAAAGFGKFIKNLPEDMKSAWKHPDSDLSKELRHVGIMEPEENLFRYDTVYNVERAATEEGEWFSKFDTLLNKGSRLSGFTSLMFQIRRIQHKMAVTTGVDRIMNHLNGSDVVNGHRLRDWGFDEGMEARIKKYVDNGTVQFKDGSVHKLNLKDWDPEDMDDFSIALNRITNQQVQKAMAGESSSLFRKGGIASMFWQLKQFPMLAIEKQTIRNLRIADDESMGMLMYSLAFAGLAYGTKQLVNGNTDRLNTHDIMMGAFNMSNVTGWVPMMTDPVAHMFGMQGINGGYGRESGPISTPASLSYLNDLGMLPGAVAKLINPFVEGSNGDVRLLQTTPIFGRMVGISYLINQMKDPPKRSKEEEPAIAKEPVLPKEDPVKDALKKADKESGGLLSLLN